MVFEGGEFVIEPGGGVDLRSGEKRWRDQTLITDATCRENCHIVQNYYRYSVIGNTRASLTPGPFAKLSVGPGTRLQYRLIKLNSLVNARK